MQAQQIQAQAQQTQANGNTSIVLIESNGTVKTLKAKDVSLDTLYKKCGFRSSEDFARQHTWEVKLAGEKHIVSAWAKKVGKANFENKYDFPPPIDTAMFFGMCTVVRTDEQGNLIGLTKETWEKIYEKLFGGFEDLGAEDEYSADELEGVDPALITSHGYLKDDFVVSDKDSEEEVAPSKKPRQQKNLDNKKTTANKKTAANKKTTANKKAAAAAAVAVEPESETESESELEEEVYTFSDEE